MYPDPMVGGSSSIGTPVSRRRQVRNSLAGILGAAVGAAVAWSLLIPFVPQCSCMRGDAASSSTAVPASVVIDEDRVVALCRNYHEREALALVDSWIESGQVSSQEMGQVHALRGGVLLLLGEDGDARAEYALAAAEGARSDYYASDDDGIVYRGMAGDTAAVRQIALCVLAHPASRDQINSAAWELAFHGGDPADAAAAMQPLAATSQDIDEHDTYAWCLFLSGRVNAAIGEARLAVRYACAQHDASRLRFELASLEGMQGQRLSAAETMYQMYGDNILDTDPLMAAHALGLCRVSRIAD